MEVVFDAGRKNSSSRSLSVSGAECSATGPLHRLRAVPVGSSDLDLKRLREHKRVLEKQKCLITMLLYVLLTTEFFV